MSEFAIFSTMVLLGQSQRAIPSTDYDVIEGIDPALVYLWLKKPR